MISSLFSRIVILLLGTLYPAYASYKAVRTKDVKEYVKWMMYWIVFALFTSAETITDIFFSFWFPFYYELKIIVVLWLLSPATEGSSILYRKFVHPVLVKREQEIDAYLARAKEQGYKTVLEIGTKGVQYATQVIMQTAIKGGGGLMNQLKKSYSVGDLPADGQGAMRTRTFDYESAEETRGRKRTGVSRSNLRFASQLPPLEDISDSEVEVMEPVSEPIMPPPARRAPRATRSTREVYFPEIESHPRSANIDTTDYTAQVRSIEDISSGYSSTEVITPETATAEAASGGGVIRRTGSTRLRQTSRPVTMEGIKTTTTRKSGSDVPSYATLPRQRKSKSPKSTSSRKE